MSQFQRLASALPPTVTRGEVEKMLRAVISEDDAWQWFGRARIPFPFAVSILKALSQEGYVSFDPARLSERGEQLAEELGVRPTAEYDCPVCHGSGVQWRDLDSVYSEYLALFDARPRGEDSNLDQGAMTPESLFRRISLMMQQGDVGNKKIAVLGDDDLASLALAMTGLPANVTVFELDARICEYIGQASRAKGLNVQVVEQDLTRLLPGDTVGQFDTFMCDPPETEAGLLLFVEKGLALLRAGDGRAGYFGATVIEASLAKWKRWQTRLLGENEIAFTHILAPFTEYVAWPDEKPLPDLAPLAQLASRPWYRFAFNRFETLPAFTPRPDIEGEHSDLLYFDEESYYRAFE